jgi:hypothetical protein
MFKSKKVSADPNPLQEKAAGWFVAKVLWLQNKWAMYMDRKINKLSVRSKKFGLMIFIGLSVLICVTILIETFTFPSPTLKIRAIHHSVVATGEIPVPTTIAERQYKKVIAFQKYMDSLNGSVPGHRIYDSIVRCRPGLLDSAKLLEKLYHSQNK